MSCVGDICPSSLPHQVVKVRKLNYSNPKKPTELYGRRLKRFILIVGGTGHTHFITHLVAAHRLHPCILFSTAHVAFPHAHTDTQKTVNKQLRMLRMTAASYWHCFDSPDVRCRIKTFLCHCRQRHAQKCSSTSRRRSVPRHGFTNTLLSLTPEQMRLLLTLESISACMLLARRLCQSKQVLLLCQYLCV